MLSTDLLIISIFQGKVSKSWTNSRRKLGWGHRGYFVFPSLIICNLHKCLVDENFSQIGCHIQNKNYENKFV